MKLASCLCPTFNRGPNYLHLLSEAVESFLRQTYERKELVILNDCPEQTLICDAPNVRVVNWYERIPTLGEKYNELVKLARGGILLPWEDDDISLPGRIEQAAMFLENLDYWKPPQVWYLEGKLHWKHSVGVRHHAGAFTRAEWQRVGGYPAVSGSQDAVMDQKMHGHCLPSFPFGIPVQEWQYIYRWGVSPWHLSGSASAWNDAARAVRPGLFKIEPMWTTDYEKLCKEALPQSESAPTRQ